MVKANITSSEDFSLNLDLRYIGFDLPSIRSTHYKFKNFLHQDGTSIGAKRTTLTQELISYSMKVELHI